MIMYKMEVCVRDQELLRLSAQVQGLEVALKSLITLHFAGRAEGEGGHARAAREAETLCRELQAQVLQVLDQAPAKTRESELAVTMLELVAATVGRCYDQPAAELERLATLSLEASTPLSLARN